MRAWIGDWVHFWLGLCVWTLVLLLVVGSAAEVISGEAMKEEAKLVKEEQQLRKALLESVQTQVSSMCGQTDSSVPTIAVRANLSEVLRAFPEKLATSPTVRCHPVPCVAITAESWPHLAEVYAKSDEGVRRIALDVGLSRKENIMTLASASVKSIDDYARPEVFLTTNGKKKFSLNLCGVRVFFTNTQQYVVEVAGHRLGALLEGEGELTLEPTCAKSRRMLVDFVPEPDDPIKVSRVFITCPFKEKKREPRQIKRLRVRVQELKEDAKGESDQQRSESMEKFLGDCIKSVYPLTEEEALQGLAPHVGYEHPMMVVQTEELGVFAFAFAGQRGSETVIVTKPRTRSIASFWESARASRRWTIPDVERYSFDIQWQPEAMRFDVECSLALSRLKAGHDIRFLMNPVCKVQRCLIDGKKAQFAQRKCAQEEKVAMSLSSGLILDGIEGFLEIARPSRLGKATDVDLTVEYSIDYGNTSATDSLGAEYLFEDAVVLHGDVVRWFPCVGFATRAPMRTRIEVPAGFMGVAMGNSETKEVKAGAEVYTYDADFPVLMPAFVVGKFTEFADKAERGDKQHRPDISLLSSGNECGAERWLDGLGTTVHWAQKYCGEFPYERLCFVTMPGNRSWATMMVFPDSYLERKAPDFWLLSHEVSHQWWGNAAGTLNMDDQWMVEGAATYFSFLWSEDLNMRDPGVVSFKRLAAWIRTFESPPPISAGFRLGQRLGVLFYVKGAYMFEMLRMATNNDRHFFATLKQYQAEAQKVGLTEAGLKAAFEKAIGHDLSGLFRLYVHKGDLPGVLVEVTDVTTEGNRATVSISAQITPGGYALPYPIDVYPKSGQAPHRGVIFIGPDFGDYKLQVPFADVSRIVGNPEAMLLVASPDQEDVELYVAPE